METEDYSHKQVKQFCEMIDDSYPLVEVCGISFSPSQILRELDPIAFSEELSNYADSEGWNIEDEDEDEDQP
jgi:hypothetical protein